MRDEASRGHHQSSQSWSRYVTQQQTKLLVGPLYPLWGVRLLSCTIHRAGQLVIVLNVTPADDLGVPRGISFRVSLILYKSDWAQWTICESDTVCWIEIVINELHIEDSVDNLHFGILSARTTRGLYIARVPRHSPPSHGSKTDTIQSHNSWLDLPVCFSVTKQECVYVHSFDEHSRELKEI